MGVHGQKGFGEALPAEMGEILKDIAQEPVPAKLLDLAQKLQSALQAKGEDPRKAKALAQDA